MYTAISGSATGCFHPATETVPPSGTTDFSIM